MLVTHETRVSISATSQHSQGQAKAIPARWGKEQGSLSLEENNPGNSNPLSHE